MRGPEGMGRFGTGASHDRDGEEKTPDVVGDVVSTLTGSPAIGEIVGYGAGAVVAGLLSILGLKKGKKVLNSIKDSPKGKYFG